MLNGVPFLPPNLFIAAMKKLRKAGYSKETPPPKGAFVPFVVAYADAACRGRGLHPVMDVMPGTKIPTMAQLMNAAARLSCWDGVVGVTMRPDVIFQPPNGAFDATCILTQWLPFLNWLGGGLTEANLRDIPRPEWYPWVSGKSIDFDPGLPDDFGVDAVVQTSAGEDFGNLTLVHNLADGPLASLPAGLSPELAGEMARAGHSNTAFVVGFNYYDSLPLGSAPTEQFIMVDEPVDVVLRAVMDVWQPDDVPQPNIRVATKPTAISNDACSGIRRAFSEGAWNQLPPPEELSTEAMLKEASVSGTIIVVSRQKSVGMAVVTNGVTREPDLEEIPTRLLPRKRL